MYAPAVIAAAEAALVDAFRDALPGGTLTRYPHATCWELREALEDAAPLEAGAPPARPLTPVESAFITNERLLAKVDFTYWAERYAYVAKETADAEPLFPLWESQVLFLRHLAQIEEARWRAGHPDGILVNCLKARQLGVSTLGAVILAHRVTTRQSIRGLIAGDVPSQSTHLLGMAEFVVEHLPWWLKPDLAPPCNKGSILTFATGASLRIEAGKSQRGKLQDREGTKGNIGRGRTYQLAHLSELSTWERPEQVYDGLLPGIPVRPSVFVLFESTAKGRHDEWHEHWAMSAVHKGRFGNIFIPWYVEPTKYWLPPPPGWTPAEPTRTHAAEVERTSPGYLFGQTHRLTSAQQYYWESLREVFATRGELNKFYEEYPATDTEAFQHAGRSVFTLETLERLRSQQRAPAALVEVRPAKDLAILREWERQEAARVG